MLRLFRKITPKLRLWHVIPAMAVLLAIQTAVAQWSVIIPTKGTPPPPPPPISAGQAIAGISPSMGSFMADGTTGQTVATMHATMDPATPGFSGTWSLVASGSNGGSSCSGGDTTDFLIGSSTGIITNQVGFSSAFSGVACVEASQAGTSNSPQFQTVSITGSAAPAAATAGCLAANGGGSTNGSCFNHLALNMDFTTNGAVSGYEGETKFSAQTLTNWIASGPGDSGNCATPAQAVMYIYGRFAGNQEPDCTQGSGSSPLNIMNDGGPTVFMMHYDASVNGFGNASNCCFELQSNSTGTTSTSTGHVFPQEFYVEMKWRVGSNFDSNDATPLSTNHYLGPDYWTYDGYQDLQPGDEWDFIEMFTNSRFGTGGNNDSGSCQSRAAGMNCPFGLVYNPSGYDHEAYQTIGVRLTQDNSGNAAWCNYINGTEQACHGASGRTTSGNPLSLIIQNGLDNPVKATGTSDLFIQYFRVWDCANWKNAIAPTSNGLACAGVVLTTNP